MSAQYYSEWHVYGDDGVKRPAFLRVELSAVRQDEVNRLLEEYRSRAAASNLEPDDVVVWLAERGIQAELVPLVPGTF